ncbi:MAG: DNA primase [Candidatus Omnitrophica bacterium]|nr:DNA primase [Candidatus Omnitrophota bacterium]
MENNLKSAIEQIQSRIDIVEIIGGYIPLKKTGASYKGLCPFHQEKTPSFIVSQTKQIYHCFGCSKGGDVINFVMEYEKVDFIESLKILAQKAGVKLPAIGSSDYAKKASAANFLYRINEMAVSYYHAILIGSAKAGQGREYLKSRGIDAQTADKFKLGFAPNAWDSLLQYAGGKSIKHESLEKAGLAIIGKDQKPYDRFRNRIIFPIFDINSKPVGFGARVLDDSMPKYINSPETEVYIKGRHLYGLNLAAGEVRRQNEIIIVEGYLDMIIPFQAGIQNIVATLGTALTIEQINLIRRYTGNTVMLYDADEAGEAASLRSLDILIGEGLNVKIAKLPKGFDPDTYVRKKSAAEFRLIVSSAKGLFDYKIEILLSKYGTKSSEAKAQIISEMLPTIKRIENAVLKSDYIKKLSQRLSVDESAVLAELKKIKLDYIKSAISDSPVKTMQGVARTAEKIIAALLMEDADIARRIKNEFSIEDFRDIRIRGVIKYAFELMDKDRQPTPARLMHYMQREDANEFICYILAEVETIIDRDKTVEDCIKWLKADNIRFKKEDLTRQIKEAENLGKEQEVMELVREFNSLSLPSTSPRSEPAGRHGV